ncbi:division/cell wall cluster transcriptional repressor MraZ [Pacificimonas sp. ICDLI1SI03]
MAAGRYEGIFLGSVDGKGRISIPAAFRDVIQQNAGDRRVVFMPSRSDKDCLDCFDSAGMARIDAAHAERFPADEISEEEEEARFGTFGLAHNQGYEETGRCVIPEELREIAEIDTLVLFVGGGSRGFQVWNPDLFLQYNKRPIFDKLVRNKLKKARAK